MSYPLDLTELKEQRRNYKDEAAAQLYRDAGGPQLVNSSIAIARALTKQAAKLEEFSSTPFTKNNVSTIKVTLESLERVQSALTEWHWLIYPNQRPGAQADEEAP